MRGFRVESLRNSSIYKSSRDEYIYNSSRVESSRVESSRVESSRLLTACVPAWHVSARPPRTDTTPDDGAWATGHDHNAGMGLSPFPRTYGPRGARNASRERRSAYHHFPSQISRRGEKISSHSKREGKTHATSLANHVIPDGRHHFAWKLHRIGDRMLCLCFVQPKDEVRTVIRARPCRCEEVTRFFL